LDTGQTLRSSCQEWHARCRGPAGIRPASSSPRGSPLPAGRRRSRKRAARSWAWRWRFFFHQTCMQPPPASHSAGRPQEEQKARSTELGLEMELPAFAHAVLWQQAAPAPAPEHARPAPPPVGAPGAPAGERGGSLALAQISDPEARARRPPCLPISGGGCWLGGGAALGIQCLVRAAPAVGLDALPRAATRCRRWRRPHPRLTPIRGCGAGPGGMTGWEWPETLVQPSSKRSDIRARARGSTGHSASSAWMQARARARVGRPREPGGAQGGQAGARARARPGGPRRQAQHGRARGDCGHHQGAAQPVRARAAAATPGALQRAGAVAPARCILTRGCASLHLCMCACGCMPCPPHTIWFAANLSLSRLLACGMD